MATSTSVSVSRIIIEDIEKVYVGDQGCACGCGGEYIYNTPENQEKIVKYLKRINNRLKNGGEVDVESVYASIEYTTRAIRIYFKDGISYSNWYGLERRVA